MEWTFLQLKNSEITAIIDVTTCEVDTFLILLGVCVMLGHHQIGRSELCVALVLGA